MSDKFAIDYIIGNSTWIERVRTCIVQVAGYHHSVLISGPSGTGKQFVARAIHAHCDSGEKPFIPFFCQVSQPRDGCSVGRRWAVSLVKGDV